MSIISCSEPIFVEYLPTPVPLDTTYLNFKIELFISIEYHLLYHIKYYILYKNSRKNIVLQCMKLKIYVSIKKN